MHQAKLLQALTQMCTDKAGRKTMGLAGQQRVKSYFKIDNVINHYIKVYEKAVATWQGSASN
jgi:hypothetical protein